MPVTAKRNAEPLPLLRSFFLPSSSQVATKLEQALKASKSAEATKVGKIASAALGSREGQQWKQRHCSVK
jgi:hypothetical protein